MEKYLILRWENYPGLDGFRLLIGTPKHAAVLQLAAAVWREDLDTETYRQRLGLAIAEAMIRDFRGLTGAGLKELIPGAKFKNMDGGNFFTATELADRPVPFSKIAVETLLNYSPAFLTWMVGLCSKLSKNMGSTPSPVEVCHG